MKKHISHRLTETARSILQEMAQNEGIAQTAMLELIIREAARKRKIAFRSDNVQGPPDSSESDD